jgi:predicted acyltransferase
MGELNSLKSSGSSVRLVPLDVFRGLTIACMIIVNTQGAGGPPYSTLVHADWIGFTVADLVFPSFLFAMGLAMGVGRKDVAQPDVFWRKTFTRAFWLFVIGYVMFWFPFFHLEVGGRLVFDNIDHVRVMGVLQRLAVCYFAAAVATRFLSPGKLVVLCIGLLVLYAVSLVLFSPPGLAYDKFWNLPARVDRAVIGIDRMYRRGRGYDPEGLLSSLPAVVNVISGYLVAKFLTKDSGGLEAGFYDQRKLIAISLIGLTLVCIAQFVSPFVPVSKKLWTSSFVSLTIGLDIIILAFLLIAHKNIYWRKLEYVLCVFGGNSLTIYILSELIYIQLVRINLPNGISIYDWFGLKIFQFLFPGPVGSFLCALSFTVICFVFGLILKKKNLYLKI